MPTTQPRLIALTGGTGFIGSHLLKAMAQRGFQIRVLLRRPSAVPLDCASAVIGDLSRLQNMRTAFSDVHAVIHTAGLAHAMSGVPEDDYRTLNTEATIKLARSAFGSGVKRFVFLSSVRAQSGPSCSTVLTEDDEPRPTDAYGRSKLAAEQRLSELEGDWVALRLPLTYGPGVRGNFARLLRLAASPYPLPFGAMTARRSILCLDNLASALDCLLRIEQPLRKPFLLSDPEALSLRDMIAVIRQALGRSAALFPVPSAALRLAFSIAGRAEEYPRFAEPLEVSIAALRRLGWRPERSSEEALAALSRSIFAPAAA